MDVIRGHPVRVVGIVCTCYSSLTGLSEDFGSNTVTSDMNFNSWYKYENKLNY